MITVVSSVSSCYKSYGNWIGGFTVCGFSCHKKISILDTSLLLSFTLALAILFVGSIFILNQMLAEKNRGRYKLPLPPNLYLILGVFIKVCLDLYIVVFFSFKHGGLM